MRVLLVHMIKQAVEHRTTKSWEVSMAAWRSLERNQRRFLGMHGEAETDEAFRQDCHHPAGIGKASQKTVALPPGEDVLDKPFVQAMMQEYIG